jgi:hypothetical protein
LKTGAVLGFPEFEAVQDWMNSRSFVACAVSLVPIDKILLEHVSLLIIPFILALLPQMVVLIQNVENWKSSGGPTPSAVCVEECDGSITGFLSEKGNR